MEWQPAVARVTRADTVGHYYVPFPAGEVMPKIVETLRQDEWWYGQDSFPYRLTEMEASHLVNVLDWLRRRAYQLRLQHYWSEFLEYSDLDESEVGPNTERAFVRWLGANPALEVDAVDWLAATPLVRALWRELARRDGLDGDVVAVRYDEELESDSDGIDGRAIESNQGLRDRPALG